MASFRKRFQSNAIQQKPRLFKGKPSFGRRRGCVVDTTVEGISRPGERAVAMLAPKDYTRFWGEQGDKFKYLANLVKSIIQVDLEMRKNKHNVEVVRDLFEMYCCLRNSSRNGLCLFGNLASQNANRPLVKMAIKGYIKYFSGKGQLAVELTAYHYIVHWDTTFIMHSLEKTLHCGLEMLLDSKFTLTTPL